MPQPHLVALGIATVAVIGFIATLGIGSLTVGAIDFLFAKPRLNFLKSGKGLNGLGFFFKWNAAKEPGKIDTIKVRLFNPFATPSQVEIIKEFDGDNKPLWRDVDMGGSFSEIKTAISKFDGTMVQVEISSSKDGISFQYDYKGKKFAELLDKASTSYDDFSGKMEGSDKKALNFQFGLQPRDMIEETVPGKGPQVAIATNPALAAYFQGSGDAGGGSAVAKENFAVSKVWIEAGCIVCNACEDIFPEVFEVTADSCIIRPNAPLDDGLKIEEAAEACPVEIIKFTA